MRWVLLVVMAACAPAKKTTAAEEPKVLPAESQPGELEVPVEGVYVPYTVPVGLRRPYLKVWVATDGTPGTSAEMTVTVYEKTGKTIGPKLAWSDQCWCCIKDQPQVCEVQVAATTAPGTEVVVELQPHGRPRRVRLGIAAFEPYER